MSLSISLPNGLAKVTSAGTPQPLLALDDLNKLLKGAAALLLTARQSKTTVNTLSSSVVTFESQQVGTMGADTATTGSLAASDTGSDFVPSGNVTPLQGRGWTVTTN